MNNLMDQINEVINDLQNNDADYKVILNTIIACKKALEQPAQEPVAWTGSGSIRTIEAGGEGFIWGTKAKAYPIPLYTHPAPSWQGLSDDEIDKIWLSLFIDGYKPTHLEYARAIEQAH